MPLVAHAAAASDLDEPLPKGDDEHPVLVVGLCGRLLSAFRFLVFLVSHFPFQPPPKIQDFPMFRQIYALAQPTHPVVLTVLEPLELLLCGGLVGWRCRYKWPDDAGYRMNPLGAIVLAEVRITQVAKSPTPVLITRPVHTTAQPQRQKKFRPILNAAVLQLSAILQLFAGEDQALLVRKDAFRVPDLLLHVLNVFRELHVEQ